MTKTVMIITNEETHFYAHLLPIALAALAEGYQVSVVTAFSHHREKIETLGIKTISLPLNRKSLNPLQDALYVYRLSQIVKTHRPDILHLFTPKPILYGSLVGAVLRTPIVINTYVGMGTLYTNDRPLFKILRGLINTLFRKLSSHKKMLFMTQNADDTHLLRALKVAPPNRIFTQCSVGVDLDCYKQSPLPQGPLVFALISRMLQDKGVYEFVEAAKRLKQRGYGAEFWLVGSPDPGNRTSIPEEVLKQWDAEGHVKYLGYHKDMPALLQQIHVSVLPSYREGLSRSLLEAAACGRAIVTTDAPGGRDLITHEVNGLLVPPKDATALEQAMERLIENPHEVTTFADAIHAHVISTYEMGAIGRKMIAYYRDVPSPLYHKAP